MAGYGQSGEPTTYAKNDKDNLSAAQIEVQTDVRTDISIVEHHIVNIIIARKVTYNRMLYAVCLIDVGVGGTVFILLVHFLHCYVFRSEFSS